MSLFDDTIDVSSDHEIYKNKEYCTERLDDGFGYYLAVSVQNCI